MAKFKLTYWYMNQLIPFSKTFSIFSETFNYLKRSEDSKLSIESLKMMWAQCILAKLSVEIEVIGEPSRIDSLLLLGNHISYLDIPLLMATTPKICFVAKQELVNWPIFGKAAKKIDTVFVKREDSISRKSARQAVQDAITNGKRVVIFPSGTTCVDENKSWRIGPFEIANSQKCWVQPFRISYSPLRAAAYIDRDFFPLHLYRLSKLESIKAKIEFHEPVKIEVASQDATKWQNWTRIQFTNVNGGMNHKV